MSSYTYAVHAPTDKELWSILTNLSKTTQFASAFCVVILRLFLQKKPENMFLERKQWLYLILLNVTAYFKNVNINHIEIMKFRVLLQEMQI